MKKKSTLFLIMVECILFINAANAQRIITANRAISETVWVLGECDKTIAPNRTSLYGSNNMVPLNYKSYESYHA